MRRLHTCSRSLEGVRNWASAHSSAHGHATGRSRRAGTPPRERPCAIPCKPGAASLSALSTQPHARGSPLLPPPPAAPSHTRTSSSYIFVRLPDGARRTGARAHAAHTVSLVACSLPSRARLAQRRRRTASATSKGSAKRATLRARERMRRRYILASIV